MIGGDKIQYGGTIAMAMDIGLTTEFCTNETGTQPAHNCVGKSGCKCAGVMKSAKTWLENAIVCGALCKTDARSGNTCRAMTHHQRPRYSPIT